MSKPYQTWINCNRCGGPKRLAYQPVCDECRFEDEVTRMFKELDNWLETGELPQKTVADASLPRPEKDGPPKGRWIPPDEQPESA